MNLDYTRTAKQAKSGVNSTLMALGRLAATAPSAYQMLEWAGVQTRRTRRRRLAAGVGWLSAGLAIGTGLTMLLTPRTGAQLQQDLRKRMQRAKDYIVPNEAERGNKAARNESSSAHAL